MNAADGGRRVAPEPAAVHPRRMIATGFDALAAARDIKATGLERAQAEAIVGAVRQTAVPLDMATKADLETGLSNLRADLYRALWIQTGAIAGPRRRPMSRPAAAPQRRRRRQALRTRKRKSA